MLDASCDVDIWQEQTRETCLMFAARTHNLDLVRLLLQRPPPPEWPQGSPCMPGCASMPDPLPGTGDYNRAVTGGT